MGLKSIKKVLAYDLGGTKVQVGVVTENGKILESTRVPVAIEKGKTGVIDQLSELGKNFLRQYPEIKKVGFASAGPLDPVRGLLLDPTNLAEPNGKSWGKVPLASLLSKKLGKPVILENDAAAAILAERWLGRARRFNNAMILTLGTGLGTGIICNGALIRAGRALHPEAGHLILKHADPSAPCGCGNFGCAEAYLSGRNFSRRFSKKLGHKVSATEIADLARAGEAAALGAFREYAELMAVAIHNYCVSYCPEIIVLSGSFSAASDMFLPATREHLTHLLSRRRVGIDLMPKIAVSSLKNNAGLLGGAFVALR